jgi:hypothetical protein
LIVTAIQHQLARLLVGAILTVGSAAGIARAQDDDEVHDRAEAIQQERLAAEQMRLVVEKEVKNSLRHWMASLYGKETSARAHLEKLLNEALNKLKTDCQPTEAQLKKLEVAGRGDIKRFMDRLDEVARLVDDAQGEPGDIETVAIELNSARNFMNTRLFAEGSLFFKTRTALGLQYPLAIARAIDSLQGSLRLKEGQRAQLLQLLRRETRPPVRYGEGSDLALVLHQASAIPEETFRKTLSEAQWRELSRWMTTYAEGSGSKEVLRKNGFLFDDTPVLTHSGKPGDGVTHEDNRREINRVNRD